MPATVAAAAGLACFLFLFTFTHWAVTCAFLAGSFLATWYVLARARAYFPLREDPHWIVIDDFAGSFFAYSFLPREWTVLIAAFLLYRFFDISKGLFIARIEKMKNPVLAIFLDDVAAGIYANIVVQLLLRLKVLSVS
jgi:phosphatidylglycerophosphatase A